jgi:hypothetical protein
MLGLLRNGGGVRDMFQQQLCTTVPSWIPHVRGCAPQSGTGKKEVSRPAGKNLMEQVRVILVSPKTPGNIGKSCSTDYVGLQGPGY